MIVATRGGVDVLWGCCCGSLGFGTRLATYVFLPVKKILCPRGTDTAGRAAIEVVESGSITLPRFRYKIRIPTRRVWWYKI
jgi:hypothetical protein